MSRTRMPITPAPRKAPRYPRVGVVWGAFAAGTLGGLCAPNLARADCALPEHTGTVDPGQKGAVKKGKKTPPTVVQQVHDMTVTGGVIAAPHPPEPPPRHLGGEPMPVSPPGRMVAPQPPPVPGAEPPVSPPQGGPVHVTPPQPTPLGGKPMPPKPPEDPKKKKEKPHLDGDLAQVGAVRYIHPHGPDEPCHAPDPAGGRLVIKFT